MDIVSLLDTCSGSKVYQQVYESVEFHVLQARFGKNAVEKAIAENASKKPGRFNFEWRTVSQRAK